MRCTNPINLPGKGKVPCGKCFACLISRQDMWTVRIINEARYSSSAWFLTLTYDDDNTTLSPDGIPVCSKTDIQLWLKRFRKEILPLKCRYFLCAEYGPKTLRPHYHAIIFFDVIITKPQLLYESVKKTWQKGFVTMSYVTNARSAYVAKYSASSSLLPEYYREKRYKPFILCSRRPGIGARFVEDNQVATSYRLRPRSYYTYPGGRKVSLPRYYRDKLYDDDMKAQLSDLSLKNNYELLLKQIDEDSKSPELAKTSPIRNYLAPTKEEVDVFNQRIVNKILKKHKL